MPDDLKERLQRHFGSGLVLEHEIGQGTMSRVYVATDPALRRRVVVKVMSPDRVAGISLTRFQREIAFTARLQHPHIVPLLSTGSIGETPYYVMPFVEGETLRARLEREGPLPVNTTLDVLRDIAEALEYAHANGVVHRDIKPDNVLLAGRNALVTDFGVAKAIVDSTIDPGATITSTGTSLGTPGYMAPEQAAADPLLDERADLYALGITAYEMLAGVTPFGARTLARLMAAHIAEEPRPVDAVRAGLARELTDLVMRCLAKDPAERPQSATDLLAALERVPRELGDVAPRVIAPAETPVSSIAVLPFENASGDEDTDYLSDGITEAILNALARVRALRVAARTSSFAFKGSDLEVREIGRRLRVAKLLFGSVRKSGSRVRVQAELVNADDGYQVWSGRFDREWDDIFDIEDEIAAAIADALTSALTEAPADPLTRAGRRPPRDLVAYELYLKGRHFLDQRIEGMWKAMQYYDRALERDPTFALAHAGLAEAHFLLTLYSAVAPHDGAPKARDAARRALELDPSVADAHVVLANVSLWYDWNHEDARRELDRAIALKPSDSLAHSCYGYSFASLGQPDEAIARTTRALEIDPLSLWVHSNLAVTLYLGRRFEESVERCRAIVELSPSYSEAYRWMALSLFHLRRWSTAYAMLEKAVQLSNRNFWPLSNLGAMLGREGKIDEARAILAELTERSTREAVPPLAIATVHYGLGDLDAAFAWLDRSYLARDFWLVMLGEDPGYSELRTDPRFAALLARIHSRDAASVRATPLDHDANRTTRYP